MHETDTTALIAPGLRVQPRWQGGVPWCDEDNCPSFDGKRCEQLGHRPDAICEPTVKEMANRLQAHRSGRGP